MKLKIWFGGKSAYHLWYRERLIIARMLCESENRFTCEQLKAHPVSTSSHISHFFVLTRQFFYGVDWNTIRDIDAPFVPNLKSITDTSYFPTDEIEQTENIPAAADSGDNAKKDLAFLGYT